MITDHINNLDHLDTDLGLRESAVMFILTYYYELYSNKKINEAQLSPVQLFHFT